MSRHAPVITACNVSKDSLRIVWKVDDFFPDPESPDEINVTINGYLYDKGTKLPGSTKEISIPSASLKIFGVLIIAEIQFVWIGGETLVSSVSTVVGANEADDQMHRGAAPAPSLGIRDVLPKTLQHPNQMTVSYTSENWNKGTIAWGAKGVGKASHEIKPDGGLEAKYSGRWTTDIPLAPGREYEFEVSVTNGFESKTGTSRISARSASNYHSVRAFLWASGVPKPTSLRQAGLGNSLRFALGI